MWEDAQEILSGNMSAQVLENFAQDLGEAGHDLQERIGQGTLTGDNALSYLETIHPILEALNVSFQEIGSIPAQELEEFLEPARDAARIVEQQLPVADQQRIWEALTPAMDAARTLVDGLSGEDLKELPRGLASLSEAYVILSTRSQEAREAVDRGSDIFKRVSVNLLQKMEGAEAFSSTAQAISPFGGFVEASLEKTQNLGAPDLRDLLDRDLGAGLSEVGDALRGRSRENAPEIGPQETRKVGQATGELIGGYFHRELGLSPEVFQGLKGVSRGLLEGVRDDFRVQGQGPPPPYQAWKIINCAGVNLTPYLKPETPSHPAIEPPVIPNRVILKDPSGAHPVREVLQQILERSQLPPGLEQVSDKVLRYSPEGLPISFVFQVNQAAVHPFQHFSPMVVISNGRMLWNQEDLSFEMAPSAYQPEAVAETLARVHGYTFTLKPDGTFSLQSGEVGIRGVFSYQLRSNAGGFSQGTVTFSVVGGDPTSETFQILVNYPDHLTSQGLLPYPVAAQNLFDFLEDHYPGHWNFNTETGVLEIREALTLKFKVNFLVEPLTEEEVQWFQRHQDPHYGLAFKVEDVNRDGVMDIWIYSPEGKQLLWGQ
ncbi:MAG: hypothetical protein DSZ24_02750 [Thermodesulfatator sp.]|nr:MAG: hypothetical protein DSZ24_02750 [Thermodesulfatator sp.]